MTGRIAIAAVAALAAGLLAAGRPVGPRLLRAVGGDAEPHLVFQVDPGEHDAAELAPIWRARLSGYGVRVEPDPPLLRVTVYGARSSDSFAVHDALIRPGVLEFYEVLEDAPLMRDAYAAAQQGRWPEVEGEVDGWRHEDTGKQFTDYFLRSRRPDRLEAAIADLPLDPGMRIVVERISGASSDAGAGAEPSWRTYLLVGEPMLTNQHIAHVSRIYDPQTNRPEVLIEFDDEGTRRFAESTRRLVGRKMAIVLDGRVASAPVIQSEIPGGRSNISMGGGDYATMDAEAQALTSVLEQRGPPLPPGLAAMLVAEYEPPASMRWGVRAGFAGLVGVATFLLGTLSVRRRWLAPAPGVARTTGGSLVRAALAVAVSLGIPLLFWLAPRIALPGVRLDIAGELDAHVTMLGLGPVLLAFVLVELVAFLVPPLRRRRRGSAEARTGIDRAVVWVALVLAGVIAWDQVEIIQNLAYYVGFDTLPGKLGRWTALISLVTGAMLYVVGARVIARWGAGNPWAILIGGRALVLLVMLHRQARWFDEARPTLLAIVLASAVLTILFATHRIAGRRAPAAGLAPLVVIPLLIRVRSLPLVRELDPHGLLLRRLDGISGLTEIALVAILAAAFAVAGGARRPAQLAAAIGYVVALTWLDRLLPHALGQLHPALLGAALAAGALELVTGALRHARLRNAVALAVHHDLDRLDAHADALAAAGIPVAVEGAAARAVGRGLAPFAPVVLRIPASALEQARAIPSPVADPLTERAAAVFD